MAVIQFKRATSARWAELNPVLDVGEPGYDIDKGRMKIGDGNTPWKDLLFQDEKAVLSRPYVSNFPSHGKENTIYKEETTQKLYQWVEADGRYKIIGTEGVLDVERIYGGNADGTA